MELLRNLPLSRAVPEKAFAVDLRIGLDDAAALRALAGGYSLWPNSPFGASADHGVWPGAFVDQDQAKMFPDRIALGPEEAAFWQAFQLWDDLREMLHHMRPLPVKTEVIALGLPLPFVSALEPESALEQLIQNDLSAETLESKATLWGYDITDSYLKSMLFDAARPEFDASNVLRSAKGLIADLKEADDLRQKLELDDPAHAPLVCVSVWSLASREASG